MNGVNVFAKKNNKEGVQAADAAGSVRLRQKEVMQILQQSVPAQFLTRLFSVINHVPYPWQGE
jgi:hypothetical protein